MPLLPALIRPRGDAPVLPFVALALAGGLLVGAVSAHSTRYGAIAVVGVMVAALTIWRPVALGIAALVCVFAVQRLGGTSFTPGSSGGVSYSDAMLTAAAFLALPALLGTAELRRIRLPLFGLAAYLASLLPTVILNQSHRADLEWVHRLVLVGGSLLLGAWLVRERVQYAALKWLLGVSCIVSVAAIADTLRHGLRAASPFQLNKNFIGGVLATVLIVLIVAGREYGVPTKLQVLATLLVAGGIVASQSRGAMLAVVAGVILALALDIRGHTRRARAMTIIVAIVLGAIAYVSVKHQLDQTQTQRLNGSIGVRFNVEKETRKVWRTSPAYGVGLKYFNTGNYGDFAVASNNAVDNELAESGIVGLAGFVVLQGALFVTGAKRRRNDKFVAAGVGAVFGMLLHGMVDIFWNAGVVTLPLVIFGMALARPPARPPDDDGPRHRNDPGQGLKMSRSARAKTLSQR